MKEEDRCEEPGNFRRFWPGKEPDIICIEHAIDTGNIAKAIGTYIHVEPLTLDILNQLDEVPRCSCAKGHPQEINVKSSSV